MQLKTQKKSLKTFNTKFSLDGNEAVHSEEAVKQTKKKSNKNDLDS